MRTLRRFFTSSLGPDALSMVGAPGVPVSTVTVTLPLPTPASGTLSVVATMVCWPSGTVGPAGRVALPLASVVAVPRVVVPSVKVMTLPTTLAPLACTFTVSGPCQPAAAPVSGMQPLVPVLGQRTAPEVGVVKVTTGAAPIVTMQGGSDVALPAGSLTVVTRLFEPSAKATPPKT